MGDPLGLINAVGGLAKPEQARAQSASSDAFKAQLRAQLEQLEQLERSVSESAQAIAQNKPGAMDTAEEGLKSAEQALAVLGSMAQMRSNGKA